MASEQPQIPDDLSNSEADCLKGGLPVETVVEILSFLSPKELVKVALLNSDYAFLAGDDQLWKPLCLRWGILNDSPSPRRWKETFKRTIEEQKRAEQQAAKRCWENTKYSRNAWGSFKRGEYALIKSRPAKVTDITVARPGKHGSSKVFIKATDIFYSGKQLEEMFPYGRLCVFPVVKETRYVVLQVDCPREGELELLDPNGKDTKVMSMPKSRSDEDELRDAWHSGEQTVVTVLQATWEAEGREYFEEAITAVIKCGAATTTIGN